jgi:hypothetical protein
MKRFSEACQRNWAPILDVLERILPPSGTVLEIASGTGQHAVRFAAALPELVWQPTDPGPEARASIEAWAIEFEVPNLKPPLDLNVMEKPWPIARADAMVCCNMIHIAPWEACLALFAGAQEVLSSGSPLYLYGPYFIEGQPIAPSNLEFDESLRSRHPEWGVRQLDKVCAVGSERGFELAELVPMPANNFSVIFRRQ